MIAVLLLVSVGSVIAVVACLYQMRRQHWNMELDRAALEHREEMLKIRESAISDRFNCWITERGEWAQELEHAKAEAQQARYWMRRAHAAEDAAAKQVQEVTA
jgi:hypothetical protein